MMRAALLLLATAGVAAAEPPARIGKVAWHLAHFSFAPPGGMRLSSML